MKVRAASADMPVSPATCCSASRLSCGVGPLMGFGDSIVVLSRVIGRWRHGHIVRSVRSAPVASPLVAAMTMCPRCGSSFLQPLRCEAKGSDVVLVELRCSDCMTWLKAPHTRADMRELDRLPGRVPRARSSTQYERLVAESMEALAACLGPALELDLVSADDFARGGRPTAARHGWRTAISA